MIKMARDFRLIPIVLLATVCLLGLKVSGLVFEGGYTLAERLQNRHKPPGLTITTADSVPDYPTIVMADQQPSRDPGASKQSWADQMFNYNAANRDTDSNRDITGSVPADKPSTPPLKTSDKAPAPPKLEIAGNAYPLEPGKINSPGERAVLERLQDRREALDSRTRDLEMRENLLKAAEKRVEAKIAELKELESRVSTAIGNRDSAEAQRFKSIVSMYESMKPKDAARIFDRLEIRILVDVTTQMNPRKMSEILAQMTPESAERLTVELANRATAPSKAQSADQLPKIEGRPSGT